MEKYRFSDDTSLFLEAVQSLNDSYKDALKAFNANFCDDAIEEEMKEYNEAFAKAQNALMKVVAKQILTNLELGDKEL